MSEFLIAKQNGRIIPLEDKIFGISQRAKARIKLEGEESVINATIGSLLDDKGKLVVLSSVAEVVQQLIPTDFADYAPIGGTVPFKQAVTKAAFGDFMPGSSFVESVATPGGTGAIRNTISNYSRPGDEILTSDWFWAPYRTIAAEQGRGLATYALFDHNGAFNLDSFETKVNELISKQKSLVILLNTPAHNPTGYSLTLSDWDKVVDCLKKASKAAESIALFVDVAYIDFAGDEQEYRRFLPKLEGLPENILPIIGYSLSKTYTLYGARCGAMICLAKTQDIADEFKRVCEFSSRGSWSNSAKLAQVILSKVYEDPELLLKVDKEREIYRTMLINRGKAFEEEAKKVGLDIVPFDTGFFVSVPCDNPDAVSRILEDEGIFLVPLAKGIRISVASISEEKCRKLPYRIKEAMKKS